MRNQTAIDDMPDVGSPANAMSIVGVANCASPRIFRAALFFCNGQHAAFNQFLCD